MAIENSNVRNTYAGNGSTTVFPFTFALNSGDVNSIEVILTDAKGRENKTLDFSLSLSDRIVQYPKNTDGQPLPRGWKITLKRAIPYTQTLNLTSQGPFFAEDIETALDRQVMMVQQLAEVAERAVTLDFGADITPEQFKQNLFESSSAANKAAAEAQSAKQNAASDAEKARISATESAKSATEAAEAMKKARKIGNRTITGDVDWNTLTEPTTYKIQATTMTDEYHAPKEYAHGLLIVHRLQDGTDHETRTLQEYYPHIPTGGVWRRMSNRGVWNEWQYITTALSTLARMTVYQIGDIAYSPSLPSWARIECVKGGTTAYDEPSVQRRAGQYIIDGTVMWIVDDVRDGARVGDIIMRPTLREGFIKANGAIVRASEYPRLLAWVLGNNMAISEEEYNTNCAKYVYNADNNSLKLPNAMERVFEAWEGVSSVEAGLPNITGEYTIRGVNGLGVPLAGESSSGAIRNSKISLANLIPFKEVRENDWGASYRFDASWSSPIYGANPSVQPPAITLIPQIKY